MAKGGRYLNKNKQEKKKGLKSFVIILVILALLACGGYLAFRLFMGSMLGNVNRAEFEEKNQDKSYEDLMAEMFGGSGGEDAGNQEDIYIPEEAEDDDVYIPEDLQAAAPAQTDSDPS